MPPILDTASAIELRALRAASMCEAFQMTAADRADQVALRTIGDGISITFGEYAGRVRRLAGGLHSLGLCRGDTLAFMLTNRPEFHLLDTAAVHLGAVVFSLYNTSTTEQIRDLLDRADARLVVLEAAFLERALPAIAQSETVERLILLDGSHQDAISLDELESAESGDFDFERTWRSLGPDDVLTLIYTSGTTGSPKGVQLTHRNLLAEFRAIDAAEDYPHELEMSISYLPMAHVAERALNHYAQMVWGQTITTCPDPLQLFAHMLDARPTRFGGVPRVWEMLRTAIEAGIAHEGDQDRREAIREAIEVGLRKVRLEQGDKPVPADIQAQWNRADEQIFSRIRAQVGLERTNWTTIGGAPAPRSVLEFFGAIGIPLYELWGMSELSCAATLTRRTEVRFGTVGRPLPGVEVELDEDGEIRVRGEIVMPGYRDEPAKSAEVIDQEGWLHTGDIGEFDDHGNLKIIDRKKELIINLAGKNMSPANIERELRSANPLIGHVIVIGDDRPHNVALIVLDPLTSGLFAAEHRLRGASPAEMANDPAILREVKAGIERANLRLSPPEQIRRFRVLPCEWAPAGEELTPSMKLRRKPIAAKYAAEIEALYGGT